MTNIQIFLDAISQGNIELVQSLSPKISESDLNSAENPYIVAYENDQPEIFNILLKFSNINPNIFYSDLLNCLIIDKKFEYIKVLFDNVNDLEVCGENNILIRNAAFSDFNILKLFLNHEKIKNDLSLSNILFNVACGNNKLDLFKYLIENTNFDYNANNQSALYECIFNKSFNILRIYINLENVAELFCVESFLDLINSEFNVNDEDELKSLVTIFDILLENTIICEKIQPEIPLLNEKIKNLIGKKVLIKNF